ncbi:hypothetical protein QKT49_gp014 [Acanthamoeba castellanii medusavirus]|uniref:Uncharacterized protein n=1 Tax=Acanthamoeba castellanii medusavirus J1 TaxID=3114988 RepID=A0A3T1CWF1_9VIRU|nr:hypothetical protein QKT49_gp014 [Acanthamoeba castellanii medusavirus]BBI30154.1 hypothetical protein [Acanthamoeba castellanii medusavirus J1]
MSQGATFVPVKSFKTTIRMPEMAGTARFVMTVYAEGRRYFNRGTYNGATGASDDSRFDECPDLTGFFPCSITAYGDGTTTRTNVGVIEFFQYGACCQRDA